MEIFKTKNLLRWLMMCVTAVALSVSLAACGDDDDDDDETGGGLRPLTGTWICDNMFGSGFKYVYNSDGTGTAGYTKSGARLDKFTDYMVKDGHLWIKWVGDDDFDDKGLIKVSGSSFRLSFDDGDEWFTFNRQ